MRLQRECEKVAEGSSGKNPGEQTKRDTGTGYPGETRSMGLGDSTWRRLGLFRTEKLPLDLATKTS